MHPYGPVQEIVGLHQLEDPVLVADGHQLTALVLGAVVDRLPGVRHHQRARHARLPEAGDDLVPVRVKPRVRDVAVGVEQSHIPLSSVNSFSSSASRRSRNSFVT